MARQNIELLEMEDEITLLNAQISAEVADDSAAPTADNPVPPTFSASRLKRAIDTVVMNPPFGTWNKGIDMVFLEQACKVGAHMITQVALF